MQWNYASFNVKSNRLTSISFNSNCWNTLYVTTHPMLFPSLKQSHIYLMRDHVILRHCVTSLALDNWGKKYYQTRVAISQTCPQCDFQCLTLPTIQKYCLLLKLKQHIKQLRKDGNRKKLTWLDELSHVKRAEPFLVIWYLKCHSSRTQRPAVRSWELVRGHVTPVVLFC